MLTLLTALIFLATLGFTLSAIYFFIEAPAAKRRLHVRLVAIRQASGMPHEVETDLLRQQVLTQVPFLDRLLLEFGFTQRIRRYLDQADVQLGVGTVLLLCLFCGFLVFTGLWMFQMPVSLSLMLALPATAIPFAICSIRRARRSAKFLETFPDALDLLSRAVRAGHAFTTALELIATEMPQPLAGEFRITYDQQNLGLPLRDALQNLSVRVPLQDVRIFITALQIQRESGGNLAEILDNLAHVVRERFKLQRQIRVFTAEGRTSLYILTIVPPLLAAVFAFLNRDYIRPLYTDPMGQKMITAGILMQITGYLIIRHITRMKV